MSCMANLVATTMSKFGLTTDTLGNRVIVPVTILLMSERATVNDSHL